MNGSTIPLIEKPKHDEIISKAKKLQKIFYTGDELSSLELDIERMQIADKMEKYSTYQKRKSLRYKVKWTVSDLNRY